MYHYDALPYESNPFPETHPRALAMLGELLGLSPAPPTACRVLELGCAAGGNLIPMAWHLRGSEFVGIDLEAMQVRRGQTMVQTLGLDNIRIIQGDIGELGDELGRFDYIVAHGVFSWVPEAVGDAMLRLYRRLLAPHGIGYISYNSRPGWHVRGMLREMLLFHTRGIGDPLAALEAAQGFLSMYAETLAGQPAPLSRHLALEVASLQKAHPSYLYHEFLEANNHAFLASEFLARAERHGLRYLCESQLERMFPSQLGSLAESFLDGVDDAATHEQYLDFFNQRTFRQSLLVHAEAQPDYDIDVSRLRTFACASNLIPPRKPELRRPVSQAFTTAEGREVPVSDPVAKAMLGILHAAYPAALPVETVAGQARAQVAPRAGADGDAGWLGELFNLYANGLVHLTGLPSSHDNRVPPLPRINALTRAWLAEGATVIPTLWHQPLDTDAFSLRLLTYLSGDNDRQALLDRLLADVRTGELVLPDGGPPRLQAMAANIDRLLTLFARNGLLECGPA